MLRKKVVLITGAGGSIGSELCAQIAAEGPSVLILLEKSELALYTIDQKLQGASCKVVCLLGDCGDSLLLDRIFSAFKVQLVVHAAAYKHVPLVEQNPLMGVMNNFVATHVLANKSLEYGVERFVFVSTDKAVNPTNVMGASKRLAEYACLSKNGGGTVFSVVRFGNVMWSTGSVLPLFYRQLCSTKVVTITHTDVTRYFMSVQEAVGLILQALHLGEGVQVLDMGAPVRIEAIAERLALHLGVEDYCIKYVGLRPGEKLYEELTLGKSLQDTDHPNIKKAQEEVLAVADLVEGVRTMYETGDVGGLRHMLYQVVPGYSPVCGIVDELWLEENAQALAHAFDDEFKNVESVAINCN